MTAKSLTLLLFSKVIISCLCAFFFKTLFDSQEVFLASFTEILYFTFNGITEVFLYSFIVLVCGGWKLTKDYFGHLEINKLMTFFIFAYVVLCFDAVVQSIVENNFILVAA